MKATSINHNNTYNNNYNNNYNNEQNNMRNNNSIFRDGNIAQNTNPYEQINYQQYVPMDNDYQENYSQNYDGGYLMDEENIYGDNKSNKENLIKRILLILFPITVGILLALIVSLIIIRPDLTGVVREVEKYNRSKIEKNVQFETQKYQVDERELGRRIMN